MKRMAYLILAVGMFVSISSFSYADDDFGLIGRELSPGFDLGGITVGALFVGKF